MEINNRIDQLPCSLFRILKYTLVCRSSKYVCAILFTCSSTHPRAFNRFSLHILYPTIPRALTFCRGLHSRGEKYRVLEQSVLQKPHRRSTVPRRTVDGASRFYAARLMKFLPASQFHVIPRSMLYAIPRIFFVEVRLTTIGIGIGIPILEIGSP